MCKIDYKKNKTSSYRMNDIEALLERLGSLKIMNEQSDEEMSAAPAPAITNDNIQAVIPKSMVPDPVWFNRDRTEFKDWWRGIQLFLKSNKVLETDDKITAILAYLRGGVADIYAQRKLDELDEELETQDWEEFVKEIKTTFSDKTKAVDAK